MPQGYLHTIAGLSEHQPECRIVTGVVKIMNVKTQRRKAQESDSHHDMQQIFRLRLGH